MKSQPVDSTKASRRRDGLSREGWAYLVLANLCVVAAFYAFSGAAMAGSFAISNAEDAAHWRTIGRRYYALLIVLLCGFLAAAVAFVRTWRRDRAEIAKRAG